MGNNWLSARNPTNRGRMGTATGSRVRLNQLPRLDAVAPGIFVTSDVSIGQRLEFVRLHTAAKLRIAARSAPRVPRL